MRGIVYLVHFSRPYHHARHYLGWTQNLDERLVAHSLGRGAKLLAAVSLAGINFEVVRIWEDKTRHFERKLKKQKNGPRFCPVCKEGKNVNS